MQGNYNETERIARQLEAVEARFEELSIRITLPEVIADGALFARLMREHSELSELNDLAVAYRKLLGDIAGAKEMLSDPELQAIQAYDVWHEKTMCGKTSMGVVRTTYVIDENGRIEWAKEKVKPEVNAGEILEYLGEK